MEAGARSLRRRAPLVSARTPSPPPHRAASPRRSTRKRELTPVLGPSVIEPAPSAHVSHGGAGAAGGAPSQARADALTATAMPLSAAPSNEPWAHFFQATFAFSFSFRNRPDGRTVAHYVGNLVLDVSGLFSPPRRTSFGQPVWLDPSVRDVPATARTDLITVRLSEMFLPEPTGAATDSGAEVRAATRAAGAGSSALALLLGLPLRLQDTSTGLSFTVTDLLLQYESNESAGTLSDKSHVGVLSLELSVDTPTPRLNDCIRLVDVIRKVSVGKPGTLVLLRDGVATDAPPFDIVGLLVGTLRQHPQLRLLDPQVDPSARGTERVFSFVQAYCEVPRDAEPSFGSHEGRRRLAYHLATLTRLHTSVNEDYRDEFLRAHGQMRFCTATEGGTLTVFSHSGGAVLHVFDSSVSPRVRIDRVASGKRGSTEFTKPLIVRLMLQQHFLTHIGDELNKLSADAGSDLTSLEKLRAIHAAVLAFKGKTSRRDSSLQARSAKELFDLWHAAVGLDRLELSLSHSIAELHRFHDGESEKRNQMRVEDLSVGLGALSLTEAIISIVSSENKCRPLAVVAMLALGFSLYLCWRWAPERWRAVLSMVLVGVGLVGWSSYRFC